jgi:hypothetical protein
MSKVLGDAPSLRAATDDGGPRYAPGNSPRRVQLSRAKGWRMPPNTVIVSRPSRWGNPFKVGGWVRDVRGGLPVKIADADMAVKLFAGQFYPCAATDNVLVTIRGALRGKNLACWCKLGEPCHADVLLELANTSPRVAGEPPSQDERKDGAAPNPNQPRDGTS